MPKKAIRTPESEEEVESKPVLDSDSLEAVLARVLGPLQAQLTEHGLAGYIRAQFFTYFLR